jgi:hypothetical protein
MMVPAARAALMAILSMGWMEEEEAMVMGAIGKPVLNANKQRLSAKKHARHCGRRQ